MGLESSNKTNTGTLYKAGRVRLGNVLVIIDENKNTKKN